MAESNAELGMIGLGVMGRNLLLNMAEHGHAVTGTDTDGDKVEALEKEGEAWGIRGARSAKELVARLARPRTVMLLVPAGEIVDKVIEEYAPLLEAGDLIVDGGNSRFTDTERRTGELDGKGIHYLGVGISGGEKGARRGPSMMPGGKKKAYERVRGLFEDVAAKVDGEPCVTWLGPRGAGHYVKMVHNGIEYGLIQLLAETYDLMKRGAGLDNDALHEVYAGWNRGELSGYLVEITASIFTRKDDRTGNRLIDMIQDQAKQKGTGKWTSQDAMDLQVPVPTIDAAVAMRDLSGYKEERVEAAKLLKGPQPRLDGDPGEFVERLGRALYVAMVATYAQGMAQLRLASERYEYDLDLEAVARIWRGGCIIRSALLEDFRSAFSNDPNLPNLLVDPDLSRQVQGRMEDLRTVVRTAAGLGLPAPAFMTALAYYDGYRSAWSPANLIQAQRDFFGSHTYERVDDEGTFHTQWEED